MAGTRIRIADIAVEYEYMNYTPDDIVNAHPHLKLEQVHAALSYYHEHQAEIDSKIRKDENSLRNFLAKEPDIYTIKDIKAKVNCV